jgi:hypothetical protein
VRVQKRLQTFVSDWILYPSKLKGPNSCKLKGTPYAAIPAARMTTSSILKLAMDNTLTASRRAPSPYPTKISLCWTLPVGLVTKTSRESWCKRTRVVFEMWVSTSIAIPGSSVTVISWKQGYRFWNREHFLFF